MSHDDVLRQAGRLLSCGVHPGPLLAMLSDEQRASLSIAATDGTPRPMTPEEVSMASALGACRFTPASFDKRFARTMADKARQAVPLVSFAHAALLREKVRRYRRQIDDHIVDLAGPARPQQDESESAAQDVGMFEGRP